jgi:hypothetical protein
MKKIILAMGTILLSHAAFAQSNVKLGIKGGLNIASLKIEEDEPKDSRLGMHAGLLAHIHLTPGLSVQPEVMYSGQGMEDRITGTTNVWKMDYVNIPVQLQYNFDNGFRLQTGPQLGFLVKAEIENQNGSHLNVTKDFKKTDVSWTLGGGYLSHSGLGIDARYNYGLTNINEFDPSNPISNRVFQVGVFYMFDNQHKAKSK